MFKRWLRINKNGSSLIIGPRRSGKTTFLKAEFPEHKYATLDDLDDLAWAKIDPKGFIQSLGKKVIIDEIQRLPILTVAVKNEIDNRNSQFIMTGSSSIGLLDSTADSLAGRIALYSMPPACFGENDGNPDHHIFTDKLNFKQIKESQRVLPDAIRYGQFPEVLTQPDNVAKQELLKNYRNSYFTRDLMQLSNIEHLEALMVIFHHLARSIGSTLEISNFAREAGISFPTTKKYLNTLIQSQLTFKLSGYQNGPAKRFVKAAKTYFADNGIMESLNVQISEGQLIENFVISELEKRRKLNMIKADQLYYYKSTGGREIDVVFENDQILYIIEIKATKTPGVKNIRNLKEFAKHSNRPTKLILFYTGDERYTEDGVDFIPIASLYQGYS